MSRPNDEVTATLVEMGYKPEIISFAMEESQNKTLEEVLDLLLFRENYYNKLLQKKKDKGIAPKLSKKISVDINEDKNNNNSKPEIKPKEEKKILYESDSEDAWVDLEIPENMKPIEVIKLEFGQNPRNIMVGKPKEKEKEKEKPKKSNQEKKEEETKYLEWVINQLIDLDSKNPNDFIRTLNKTLEGLEKETNEVNSRILKSIETQSRSVSVLKFKNQIYAVVSKVLTMKVPGYVEVNYKELDELLLSTFKMQLLSIKQAESTINFLGEFYKKRSVPENAILIKNLEKYLQVQQNNGYTQKFKEDKQQQEEEEVKIEEKPEEPSSPVVIHHVKHIEDCIVCMEKTREVVLLPCSHFLTCQLCSPRLIKCPMCNKRIEKHLKIFWS